MSVYFGGEVEVRKEGRPEYCMPVTVRLWISLSFVSGEVKARMGRFAGEAHSLFLLGFRT